MIARASKGKAVTLPRTVNHFSDKDSLHNTGFNDAMWGMATRSYTTSAHALPNAKFNDIIQGAQEFVRSSHPCSKITQITKVINVDDDEWACLDISDDDCKLF